MSQFQNSSHQNAFQYNYSNIQNFITPNYYSNYYQELNNLGAQNMKDPYEDQLRYRKDSNDSSSSSDLPFSLVNEKPVRRKLSHEQIKAKYKTELCKYYEINKGFCKFGDNCAYAHGKENLRIVNSGISFYKLKPCRQFTEKGFCPYGTRCQFSHSMKRSRSFSYVTLLEMIEAKDTIDIEDIEVKRLPIFLEVCNERMINKFL